MLVIMDLNATESEIKKVEERIKGFGYQAHFIPGRDRLTIGVTGNRGVEERLYLESLPGVLQVIQITKAYKLASRETHQENSVVQVDNVQFGDGNVVMIAGPCAVESMEQTLRIADAVASRGAQMLRGGAYKPRTSPYSFQGLGEKGLEILTKAREKPDSHL